jgi:hypothetical protein
MVRLIIKILVIVLKRAAADSDFWITNRFLSPNALNASLIYRSQRLDPRGFPTHTAILVDLRNCPLVHASGFLFGPRPGMTRPTIMKWGPDIITLFFYAADTPNNPKVDRRIPYRGTR